jgi:hypothetical protein
MIRISLIAAACVAASSHLFAQTPPATGLYAACILENMRGVTSDVAAQAIVESCHALHAAGAPSISPEQRGCEAAVRGLVGTNELAEFHEFSPLPWRADTYDIADAIRPTLDRERRPMTRLHTEGATFISAFARNQQNRAYVMRVRFSTRTGVTNQTMFCFKLTDNVQTRYEVIN